MSTDPAKISEKLKGACATFAMRNLLEDFYESRFGESLLEDHDERDFQDKALFGRMYPQWIDAMDKYILFGETQEHERVIDVIARRGPRLSLDEKSVLRDWRDRAFCSVFEMEAVEPRQMRAFDVVAEAWYDLRTNNPDISMQSMLGAHGIGDFLLATAAPTGGIWFLSGSQQVIGKEREMEIFERFIKNPISLESIYRNNPDKLNRAFELQKIQYNKFMSHFGSHVITGFGQEVQDRINEFYQSQSPARSQSARMPDLPGALLQSPSVSAVMHRRQGLHFFNEYEKFVKIFSDLEKQSGWNELITGYLEDDQIPAFVFEEMKEKYPDNFRLVMNDIAAGFFIKKRFDLVDDFEIMMDEFKPGWKEEFPSVHPVNERFQRHYYRSMHAGRNDPCPCGSGKKFKRCCGA